MNTFGLACSHEIVVSELTDYKSSDDSQAPILLDQINGTIFSLKGDAAYDTDVIRDLSNQKVEAKVGCKVLNIMAKLGMPQTSRIA
jgi:hypothetical protein